MARAKSGKPVSKREKASVIALLHFYTRTPIFSPAPNSPTAVGSPGLAAQTQLKHISSTMEYSSGTPEAKFSFGKISIARVSSQ